MQPVSGVLAYALHNEGSFHRDSLGAVSEAARLASELGEEAAAIVVGGDELDDALCASLGRYGARRVYRARAPAGLAEPAVDAIASVMRRGPYRYALLGGGLLGVEIGAALAARLGGGVTMEVIEARLTGSGDLVVLRSALRDSARVRVGYVGRPGVVIGRRGAFAAVEHDGSSATVSDVVHEPSPWANRARMLRRGERRGPELDLEQAEVIVAGGRGVGGAEGFRDLEALASALGGVVAATRAAVDAGWYPYSAQVGQTGKAVSPRLYVACGVSGATQHRVGVQAAGAVLAINRDAGAPIFAWADMGVVGELAELLPRLIRALSAAGDAAPPSLESTT